MTLLRAACIQMRSGIRPEQNFDVLRTLIADAARQGARYVQTPEMTGFVQRHKKPLFEAVKSQRDEPLVALAAELAKTHNIFLHIGSTAILRADGKVANRAFLFAPDGALVTTYDKIHMFDVDLDHGERWRESAIYEPGNAANTAKIDNAELGFGICYDLRFPALSNAYGKHGVDILTYPACFTRQTGRAHWHTLLKARAIENGTFIVAAAQGGDHEDGRETFGHSLIVNPWGEIIAEKADEEPGVIVVDLDLSEVAAARGKVPNLKNEREFEFTARDNSADALKRSVA